MKTKPETKVTAKITVEIGGQSFELTTDEAKKLKAQLESAIPEKEIKWPAPPPTPERVFIPIPYRDRPYFHQERQYRTDEITCRQDMMHRQMRGALEC